MGDRFATKDSAIAAFEAHVAEVKATIPADRLLVYELGSGWEPLCAFLRVPVPSQAYSHTNSTAAFQKENIELQE